jgi:ankyrin repeat protein
MAIQPTLEFRRMNKALGLGIGLVLLSVTATTSWAGGREDQLWQAVRNDDHAAIKSLLAHHAKPNAPLLDGSTVLGWAVNRQDEVSVRLLLAAGAKPNVVDHDGASPLILACELGDPAIITDLLKAGADAKANRPDGISALALCAGTSSPEALNALLAKGADVNAADPTGQTPLMWAAFKGATDNMAVLITHGANVNASTHKGFTPLVFALKSKNADAQGMLLDAGADMKPLPDGTSILDAALLEKDFPFVMRLVSSGAIDLKRRDALGRQFIHLAAASGSADLVKLVLSKGGDPNAMTDPPPPPPPPPAPPAGPHALRGPTTLLPGPPTPTPVLQYAAKAGSAAAMRVLVEAGAKPDVLAGDGTTLTLAAAGGGNLEALKYALELDPNINAVNRQGRTVKHMVVANRLGADDPAMIEYLAEKGAKLELKDSRGVTPGLYVNVAGPQAVRVAYIDLLKDHGIVSAFHDDPAEKVPIPDALPVKNSDK